MAETDSALIPPLPMPGGHLMNTTTTPLTSTDPRTPTVAGGTGPGEVAHLLRVRSGVRAVLALGVAASVAANVLHAEPTIVGRAVGAWSPLALLLTVELISRVPAHRPVLSGLRMASTALIAGIAAWVSYWHMVAVVTRTGETGTSAHLLPLSVDGLVVVASVSLVEIAARLRQASTPPAAPVEAEASTPEPVTQPEEAAPVEAEPTTPEPVTAPAPVEAEPEAETVPVPVPRPASRVSTAARGPAVRSAAEKVTRLRAKYPAWTVGQIAEKARVSERTARRHLNTSTTTPAVTATPAVVIETAPVAEPDITTAPDLDITDDDIAA